MTALKGARIAVAGAGAVGSAVAAHLASLGAKTLLADPAALADNASGIAAGMLAPALEAALDRGDPTRFDLLRRARDRWGPFGDSLGLEARLRRCGSLWVAAAARPETLRALGAAAETVSAAQAARLAPGLVADGAVYSPEDWLLDPHAMLAALRAAFLRDGGRLAADAIVGVGGGEARLGGGKAWAADWTVFCGGHPSTLMARAIPELACLAPIKGQILRYAPGVEPAGGTIVRGDAAYVAPGAAGPAAGATMEYGRNDRVVDPEAIAQLRAAAAGLFPGLAKAAATGWAAVRASTPDGLPLIGASATPGVLIASGARRNGWLLAPMIAEEVASLILGAAPSPLFDPARFRPR